MHVSFIEALIGCLGVGDDVQSILAHQRRQSGATTVIIVMPTLRVVLAPNAFKGTLTAREAARAMARGVREVVPEARCLLLPIADGGDGSVASFLDAGYAELPVDARDAHGRWRSASIAMRDGTAVVEVANTCGLALPSSTPHRPMRASTLGLGDAIVGALDAGARSLVICLGGSSSTDGGSGMLVALGARLIDSDGEFLAPSGASLPDVMRLDLGGLDPRLTTCDITVLTDVAAPLFGPTGAAQVFAPQKGASPEEVDVLDEALRHWAGVLADATEWQGSNAPGAGAAGGAGAAAAAVLGAPLESGGGRVAELMGLPEAITASDLVITGEGRLDEQTLQGKGSAVVLDLAAESGIPVIVVCGDIALSDQRLAELGVAVWAAAGPVRPAEALVAATARSMRTWLLEQDQASAH